jgi:Zn-dependent alcohol dehydrogenase
LPSAVWRSRRPSLGSLDWTVVAAGGAEAAQLGVEVLAPGGTAVFVALSNAPVPLDFTDLVEQEKTVRGSSYGSRTAIDLAPRILGLYESGRLPLDAMVTRRPPLDEIATGFELAATGDGLCTVLDPWSNS